MDLLFGVPAETVDHDLVGAPVTVHVVAAVSYVFAFIVFVIWGRFECYLIFCGNMFLGIWLIFLLSVCSGLFQSTRLVK